MHLRFRADVRTLIWAFVLMPGLAAIQYAAPRLAGWMTPASMYLAFCAGVIAHNHNHCPIFVERRANSLLSMWISFFYGFPVFAWIPTHNDNHHRFVNRPGDATITWRASRRNRALAAVTYFFVSSRAQAPLIARFLRRQRTRSRRTFAACMAQYVVVFGGHGAACALSVAWHGLARGLAVYASALGVPALFALWAFMFTNYVQHVDCDPWSPFDHSRNFVSPWMNNFLFDNGFHTIHHQRPGLHWSRLRVEHARIAHRVDPRLQERTIVSYCLRVYVLARFCRRLAPVPIGSYVRRDSPIEGVSLN
jgi:beta-carotene hydroxylase